MTCINLSPLYDAVTMCPFISACSAATYVCQMPGGAIAGPHELLAQAKLLWSGVQDTDPYVRKTAAICVAKLHDVNAELVHDRGFLDMLRDLTNDANPMVVSNAVAALSEIYDMSGGEVYTISRATAGYLLTAMEQCTEWGQVRSHIDTACLVCCLHIISDRVSWLCACALLGQRAAAYPTVPRSGRYRTDSSKTPAAARRSRSRAQGQFPNSGVH